MVGPAQNGTSGALFPLFRSYTKTRIKDHKVSPQWLGMRHQSHHQSWQSPGLVLVLLLLLLLQSVFGTYSVGPFLLLNVLPCLYQCVTCAYNVCWPNIYLHAPIFLCGSCVVQACRLQETTIWSTASAPLALTKISTRAPHSTITLFAFAGERYSRIVQPPTVPPYWRQ